MVFDFQGSCIVYFCFWAIWETARHTALWRPACFFFLPLGFGLVHQSDIIFLVIHIQLVHSNISPSNCFELLNQYDHLEQNMLLHVCYRKVMFSTPWTNQWFNLIETGENGSMKFHSPNHGGHSDIRRVGWWLFKEPLKYSVLIQKNKPKFGGLHVSFFKFGKKTTKARKTQGWNPRRSAEKNYIYPPWN